MATSSEEPKTLPSDGNGDFKIPSIPQIKSEEEDKTIKNESNPSEARPEKIPYSPPDWKLVPPAENGFYVEVIKNGTIVDVIKLHDLKGETFITVGRFPPCEIQLDHPSVSRYHCVLQYGKIANHNCWSIYDLGSTHGTRLNKQALKKRSYVPLRPGYVLQFAGSTRIFSFCGPSDDDESLPSSDRTVAPITTHSKPNDDSEANPGSSDGKYYEKDPLGYLDKYFEREGVPMNFQYAKAEKGAAEWSCSIELPDFPENEALIAGTGVTRKLAQISCATQACQRLHAAGLLSTTSIWNKRVTYAENDYYDSDEDTYLDRTGQIEAQRAKRRKRCEGTDVSSSGSLTYDELVKSLAETEEKLKNTAAEIQRLLGKNCYADADGQLVSTSTNFSTRMALSQMRAKEKRFVEESKQLKRLVELTKPRHLSDIMPITKQSHKHAKVESMEVVESTSTETDLVTSSDDKVTTEVERNERQDNHPVSVSEASGKVNSLDEVPASSTERRPERIENDEGPTKPKQSRVYQPTAPPPNVTEKMVTAPPSNNGENVILPKYGLITREEARIKTPTLAKRKQRQDFDDELEEGPSDATKYSSFGDDDSTWMPPQDQSGDGTTKLNKKFEGRY